MWIRMMCVRHSSSREDVLTASQVLQDGSKRWQSGDAHHFPIPHKEDPWEGCFKQVQKYDEEMCRGWREEVDTLLVFVSAPTLSDHTGD
jgi:hypothetical protein